MDPTTYELDSAPVVGPRKEFASEEIVEPLHGAAVNEVARGASRKIVASAYEADMALVYGVGFPPFRGGACRYVDQTGIRNFVALCDKYATLGKAYEAPQLLREMAAGNKKFFPA